MGSAAICIVLAGDSLMQWQKATSPYLLAGSVLHLAGSILVTIACNVPLNNAPAVLDGTAADAATIWTQFVTDWTVWIMFAAAY